MRSSKQETTLNEKDALEDILSLEKLLMSYYSAAIVEGSTPAFRKEVMKNYTECAGTQFAVFEQMLSRGYYDVKPVEPEMLEEKKEIFSKVKKQLASGAGA